MSLKNILKLAARFEVKLAQQAAPKIQVPPAQLQAISAILGQINQALNAKSKEEMLKYVNPANFSSSPFNPFSSNQSGGSGSGRGVGDWVEGNLRGRSYMSTYHSYYWNDLSEAYKALLDLYNKLIDGVKLNRAQTTEFMNKLRNPLQYLKDGKTQYTNIYSLLYGVERGDYDVKPAQQQQPAAPAAQPTAPKTWGA